MRKTTIYTLLFALVSCLVTGCGAARQDGMTDDTPMVSASPMIVTPDPEDGFIEDDEETRRDRDDRLQTKTPDTGSASPSASPAASPSASPAGR